MAPTAGDATVGPLLAYSQEEPGDYELPFDSLEEFVPELEDEEAYTAMIAPPPPKKLLMGSALAFVVMAFATLAVTVAINIRPVADVSAQPVPPVQSDTVPGRYLPPVPHEPDPVALPIAVVSPAPAAPARRASADQPGADDQHRAGGSGSGGAAAGPGPSAGGPGGPDSTDRHFSAVEPVPPADVPDDADDRYDDADDDHHYDNDHDNDADDYDTDDHDADDHDGDDHVEFGAVDDSVVAAVDRDGDTGDSAAGDAGTRVHACARVHTAAGACLHPASRTGLYAARSSAGASTR